MLPHRLDEQMKSEDMSHGGSMQLTMLDDFGQFCELKEEWDALARSQVGTVFLTHNWLSHWWRRYHDDSQLRTVVLRDSKGLAGIAPLMLKRGFGGLRRLAFMGTGEVTPNHLDVIARPDARDVLEDALADYLCQTDSQWDVLDLDKLPSDRGTAERLGARLRDRDFVTSVELTARCLYIELPDSFESYLQERGSQTRRNFRTACRRLEKEVPSVRFVRASTPDEVHRVMAALIEMHQARWRRRGYVGAFATQRFVEFHRDVALSALQDGSLRLYSLRNEEQILAVRYAFRIGDCVQGYISGFDERLSALSVGMVSLAGAIEQSILEGARRFDLLEGDESYKSHWAPHTRDNVRLRAFSPRWRGQLARVTTEAGTAIFRLGLHYTPAEIRRPLREVLDRLKVARQGRSDRSGKANKE